MPTGLHLSTFRQNRRCRRFAIIAPRHHPSLCRIEPGQGRKGIDMGLILLILIIILLFGGGGYYGYRSGYYGGRHYGGGLGLILLIVILFLLFGGGGYWHY
jgi:hypothetical protein